MKIMPFKKVNGKWTRYRASKTQVKKIHNAVLSDNKRRELKGKKCTNCGSTRTTGSDAFGVRHCINCGGYFR